MSALREAPDAARQLLAAIGRELARAQKHLAVYRAAGRPDAAARLARRIRMLDRLRADAALRVDPTARLIGDDGEATDAPIAPHDVVYPIDTARSPSPRVPPKRTLAHIEFPAMTAEALDEVDLLDGLV